MTSEDDSDGTEDYRHITMSNSKKPVVIPKSYIDITEWKKVGPTRVVSVNQEFHQQIDLSGGLENTQ